MGQSSLINEKTDNAYLCKYRVMTLAFSIGDKQLMLKQSNVLSIDKIDYFEYKLRSILHLRLAIDIRQKIWILANKSDIVCKFELDKFGMDREAEKESSGEQIVWNQEFSVYLTDDDAAIDVEALENQLKLTEGEDFKINDIDDTSYFNSQEIMDIYLYNAKLIKASTTQVNAVNSSDLLINAAADILTKTKHPHVVMSPFENNTIYKELFIPSTKAYEALVYLDQYYGFYKTGASIFYDVDRLYIVNTNGKATPVKKEWSETVFMVTERDNSTPGNGMIRRTGEEIYYVNVPEESVSPKKPSDSMSVEYGETIQIITTDDIKVETDGNSSNVYTAYTKTTDNPFAQSIIRARMNENDAVIYISGDNFDINAFTINKSFKIVFEDTSKQLKYGDGLYRLAYACHALRVETDSYMKSSHQIIIKRCS